MKKLSKKDKEFLEFGLMVYRENQDYVTKKFREADLIRLLQKFKEKYKNA